MKLVQILGNTWAIEADELIPVYKLDDSRCILLDSGLEEEREAIDTLLQREGLIPVGILCSHAHVDHCANSRYFQEKYQAKTALTVTEAGTCSSLLALKCYFLTLPVSMVEEEAACMLHTPDVIIPSTDGPFEFCGAVFQIIHTPGHSPGHVCIVTPDQVLYAADALLSWEFLNAKLPYNLAHKAAMESRQKLRHVPCHICIIAHRGICSPNEIGELIDLNDDLLDHRADEILALIDHPMTASEINQAACGLYELFTKRPHRALYFERNVRFLTEYLLDCGRLVTFCRKGVTYYRASEN